MKGNYILDHGARFELVKRTSRELDAEAGQETTFVGRSNDTRSDPSTVSQTVKGWSGLDVEEVSADEPTESCGFGTANHPRP